MTKGGGMMRGGWEGEGGMGSCPRVLARGQALRGSKRGGFFSYIYIGWALDPSTGPSTSSGQAQGERIGVGSG